MQLQRFYQHKIDRLTNAVPDNQESSANFDSLRQKVQLQLQMLEVERSVLTDSLTDGVELNSELTQRLLRELDLESSRLLSIMQTESSVNNE